MNSQLFVCVDFKCANRKGAWLCYCIMVSEYPTGTILYSTVGYCHRHAGVYDESTMAFWNKHRRSYDLIVSEYADNVQDAELLLCQYIGHIVREFPNARVISDNPQYDIRILDNVLTSHGWEPVSCRGGSYSQCVCTVSFERAVLAMYKHTPPTTGTLKYNRDLYRDFGPRHTPKADCARILARHFDMLDIIQSCA